MCGAQAQHRQRQADIVVQVAAGGQALVLAHRRGKDGRDHFLDRGLAVAAGHRHRRQRELAAPAGAQLAQREARVRRDDGRHACIELAADQHGGSAADSAAGGGEQGGIAVELEHFHATPQADQQGTGDYQHRHDKPRPADFGNFLQAYPQAKKYHRNA
ncbi:hypothetical protein D9M73_227680 [compost metagenome]